MTNEKGVRRLAADILKCGERRLWLDNNEVERLKGTSTREQIKGLIEEGIVIKKQDKHNSRGRFRKRLAAKRKGRHMGIGKRRGTANARMSVRRIWIKKIRAIRMALRGMKEKGDITKQDFRVFYMQAKGNMFKHRSAMERYIASRKAEEQKIKELEKQAEALKISNRA